MNQTPSKNDRKVNKILYILTVTLLFAIAVVVALTSAANRGNKKTPGLPETGAVTEETKIPEMTAPLTTDKREDPAPPAKKETEKKTSEDEPSEPTVTNPELSLPTVGILSKKHDLSLQVYSATMDDYRVHSGIDIVTKEGAPVYAAAKGTVSQIWDDPLMGNCISIKHTDDLYTVYKNLSPEHAEGIEEGAKVSTGQMISSVGGSAMVEIAEETHLHFEVLFKGVSVDPLEYFDATELTALMTDSSYES